MTGIFLALVGCASQSSFDQAESNEMKGVGYAEWSAAPPVTGVESDGLVRVGGMAGELADPEPIEEKKRERLLARIIGRVGGKDDIPPAEAAEDHAPDARMRQWFPEAFLWQPLVQTDATGLASVDVRVPDQLTTWRVLALAHDRAGHQSGAVHTFDSTLPVAVDPVVPGWLFAGDRVVMPTQIQAMAEPFSGRVVVEAGGALEGAGADPVALSMGGSAVVRSSIVAMRSGEGLVRAEIFARTRVDGAERRVPVRPTGRPVVEQRGGVLSGPRSFTFEVPAATEQRTVVQAFPGPLAMLHAELDRVGDAPPGAYGYALLAGVETLSAAAGVEVDATALRTLRIRSWQRVIREARSPDSLGAASILQGLAAPPDSLSETLRDRMVRTVTQGQRGDGTWSREARSTLQAVLVQTAFSARVLPETETGPRLRASGALERNLPNVEDPFTAAWLLASGLVDTDLRPGLQAIVLEGISEAPDGRRRVVTPSDVRDPMGRVPTRAQVLAVTSHALADREDLAWRGDLVSELLQGWSAERGFGAGWADPLALEAVIDGLAALDAPVQIILEREGIELARGSLDPKQPKVPVVLEALGGGALTVRSEPAVPGLAFVATHTAWVPFTGREQLAGVEVEVKTERLVAGQAGRVTLSASGPSGASLEIVQGIPAGTAVEIGPSTRELLAAPPRIEQDRVVLVLKPFGAGEVKELRLEVTPTFPGRMGTRALELSVGRERAFLAPKIWTVSAGEGT